QQHGSEFQFAGQSHWRQVTVLVPEFFHDALSVHGKETAILQERADAPSSTTHGILRGQLDLSGRILRQLDWSGGVQGVNSIRRRAPFELWSNRSDLLTQLSQSVRGGRRRFWYVSEHFDPPFLP